MHTAMDQLRKIRMTEPPRPQPGNDSRVPESDANEDAEPLTVRSEELLRGTSEIHILHGKDVYRLRLTHNGRLILSK